MSFLFVAFVWSFFIRCFGGGGVFLPLFLKIIFHTVLVFVLVFIFDVKFFQVSCFDSLIVLCSGFAIFKFNILLLGLS